jgi:hypothetical protein
MTDPVILCETRLSYQRRHIEVWIITHGYNHFYKHLFVYKANFEYENGQKDGCERASERG